jgi:hypothetical protein
MTKDKGSAKSEWPKAARHWFEIEGWVFLRHLTFVIRHLPVPLSCWQIFRAAE